MEITTLTGSASTIDSKPVNQGGTITWGPQRLADGTLKTAVTAAQNDWTANVQGGNHNLDQDVNQMIGAFAAAYSMGPMETASLIRDSMRRMFGTQFAL